MVKNKPSFRQFRFLSTHPVSVMHRFCYFLSLAILSLGYVLPASAQWPQAAGPGGNFSVQGQAPVEFSATHGRNILWRAKLPSTGQGTPVISNGRVFVTSHEAVKEDTQYGSNIAGMCFDAKTGKLLWQRVIPGVRNTDLSSLFSDNTAASPVADGERVCFVNVGGCIRCFDYDGNQQWSYNWTPFGRHHARLHEPFLHDGNIITVQYTGTDLQPEHTTKAGAKPLGRGRKYWTHLQAFDMKTGQRKWIAKAGTSIHQTSLPGVMADGTHAILTGRGGGHQPPEEPYGMSLVNAANGDTIWSLAVKGFPSAQNACWNARIATGFAGQEHLTIDTTSGKLLRRTPLYNNVIITRHNGEKYVRQQDVDIKPNRRPLTKNTNLLIGDYHYFRSDSQFLIGRVHTPTGKVEYLQVPAQVVRQKDQPDVVQWKDALPNDMKNADGFVVTMDKRNAGNGWGHVSAASPLVVGDYLYYPTMTGMVYVLKWNAAKLDENALISISDLGPATRTWTLSSLSYADGRIYARTLKELICIGQK